MPRILLISGNVVNSKETLRRKLLRFTGSRKAVRTIMKRIDAARRVGHVMSCMILPRTMIAGGDDAGWDVRVSFATIGAHEPTHA